MIKKILAITLIFSFPFVAFAANPSRVGSDTTAVITTSATVWTIGITVSGSGTNRCLKVVVANAGSNANPDSVTFNGSESLSLLVDFTAVQTYGATVWYVAAPTATTANLVIDWGVTGRTGGIWEYTLQNCAQATPLDTSGTTASASATSILKQIAPTDSTDLNFAMLISDSGGSSYVSNSGQTTATSTQPLIANDVIWDEKNSTSTSNITMGWSWTTAGPVDIYLWAIKGVADTAVPALSKGSRWFE